ncbi:hypothetical protein ACFVIZ_23145 [Streptomyces anulatus]|uniref:hypothetical protein n=1 Tax=Streptomyces anulatus TaxID=1892 RepID=UPI003638328C
MRNGAPVRPAERLRGRLLKDSSGRALLFSGGGGRYLAVRGTWNTQVEPGRRDVLCASSVGPEGWGGTPLEESHLRYGGPGSFILDMQGIDAFLFARAKLFQDATARAAVTALGLTRPDTQYLRVGAAGAPPTPHHPGGEVLEHSLLCGSQLSGESWTASGHLPAGSTYSVRTPLTVPSEPALLESRSVYSHTAFLPRDRGRPAGSHLLRLRCAAGELNALDVVSEFARVNRIESYAVRIFARYAGQGDPTRVIGRVLRRLPSRRMTTVGEATAIASECEFRLAPGQELHCYGTYYPRRSADWEALRGGKPYEPRGHIHMELRGHPVGADQHAVSHLRELIVTPATECFALINPVSEVVRIEPVVKRGEQLLSRCSGRVVLEDFDPRVWRWAP